MTVDKIKKHIEEVINDDNYMLNTPDGKCLLRWAKYLEDERDAFQDLRNWIEDEEAEELMREEEK